MAELRILIVRVGAMGDVLHGMPAVAALRAAMPGTHVAWAVEPRWASLLQAAPNAVAGTAAMPLVDRVHLVPAKAWSKAPASMATLRSIAALRRELRAERYDVAIDLQGTIRSSVIATMSGARRVVGSDAAREGLARLLYSERVPVRMPHVVQQAAEIVAHVAGVALKPMPVPLPLDAEAERWCDAALADVALAGKTLPLVFVAPTAGWGAKQWPAERYGAVAAALSQSGWRVLVNAAPAGVDRTAAAVIAASGGAAVAMPCTLAQLTALLRRVSLVIAGDSGPLHLAAALGVPVVALFGPTDPARNGPWGSPARVLRHASSATDHRRHTAAEAGLTRITEAEVIGAAMESLRESSARG